MSWLKRKSKKSREEKRWRDTERIAYHLYQNRILLGRSGDERSDWEQAEKIVRSPWRIILFASNQPFIKVEKYVFEPCNQCLKSSAFFDIVDRLSPALEAIGVIFIPIVLYLAGQAYQKQQEAQEIERLQQEAVQNYVAQLSEILLNIEGDLRSPENARIRRVATAATITLLRDSNLSGERKGQVIAFLSQMDLVQGPSANSTTSGEKFPIISLSDANLSNAMLGGLNLSNSFLFTADLSKAILILADLSGADLSRANLSEADILQATLIRSDLTDTNFSKANLKGAKLNGANLTFAQFEGANLSFADLQGAYFNQSNFSAANLSNVNLSGSDFRGVVLVHGAVNLSNAKLVGTNLSKMNLSETNFQSSDLSKADLSGSNLSGANLSGANLGGANLSNTFLDEAKLNTIDLNGALLCKTILPESISLDPDRDCDKLGIKP